MPDTVTNFRTMLRRNIAPIFAGITALTFKERSNNAPKYPRGSWKLIDGDIAPHPKTEGNRTREIVCVGMAKIEVQCAVSALDDEIDRFIEIIQDAIDAAMEFPVTYAKGKRTGGISKVEMGGWHPRTNEDVQAGTVTGPVYIGFEVTAWLKR